MLLRVFSLLLFLILCTSCENIPFSKKQQNPILDTIINFNEVDFSPSFKVCDSLIDKDKKSLCFRKTIHEKIAGVLQKYPFSSKDSINEIVTMGLIINSEGSIILDQIIASSNIHKQLPALDSLLKVCVKSLPKIHPAVKRGIPVTTHYQLPIRIQLKEPI